MNKREKKTTATKPSRAGVASVMRLMGCPSGLGSNRKKKTLTEEEAINQATSGDFAIPESGSGRSSLYSQNPFASNLTTPHDSALQSIRQDLKVK